jgi:ankyrin repeat protein
MTATLGEAAAAGDIDGVRALLQAGEDVDQRGEWGTTPLMRAAAAGHVTVVRLLLDHGADPAAQDASDRPSTALRDAIRGRHAGAAREIFLRTRDPDERAIAVTLAAANGDAETVEALLDAGADPDAPSAMAGRTPLLQAVADGNAEIAALLLRRGARIDAPNRYGCTPLMVAVLHRDASMAEWLLEAGAALNATDVEGRSPLALAELGGDERLIALLSHRDG